MLHIVFLTLYLTYLATSSVAVGTLSCSTSKDYQDLAGSGRFRDGGDLQGEIMAISNTAASFY